MKTKILIIAALAACLTNAFAEESATQKLEAGYTAAAEHLRDEVVQKLSDPKVCDSVLAQLRKEQEFSAKLHHRKPFDDIFGLRLTSFSVMPPSLRVDRDDLYNRFRSTVVYRIVRLDSHGEPVKMLPYEIEFPVAAGPEMHWKFPEAEDVIMELTLKCGQTALSMAQTEAEIAEMKRSLKKK